MEFKLLNITLLTTCLSAAEQAPISGVEDFFKIILTVQEQRDHSKFQVTGLDKLFSDATGKSWCLSAGEIKTDYNADTWNFRVPSFSTFVDKSDAFQLLLSSTEEKNENYSQFNIKKDPNNSWVIKFTLFSHREQVILKALRMKCETLKSDKFSDGKETLFTSDEKSKIETDATIAILASGWPKIEFHFTLKDPKSIASSAPFRQQPTYSPQSMASNNYRYQKQSEYAGQRTCAQPKASSSFSYAPQEPRPLTKEELKVQLEPLFRILSNLPDADGIEEICYNAVAKLDLRKIKDLVRFFTTAQQYIVLEKPLIISVLTSLRSEFDGESKFEPILKALESGLGDEFEIRDPALIRELVKLSGPRIKSLLMYVERYLDFRNLSIDEKKIVFKGLCQYYSSARDDFHRKKEHLTSYGYSDPEVGFDLELRSRLEGHYINRLKLEMIVLRIRTALPILNYISNETDEIFELIFISGSLQQNMEIAYSWLQNMLMITAERNRVIDIPQDLAISAIRHAKFLPHIATSAKNLEKLYGKKNNQDLVRKLISAFIRHSTSLTSSQVIDELNSLFASSKIKLPSGLSDAKIDFISSILMLIQDETQFQKLHSKLAIFKDSKHMKGRNLKSTKTDVTVKFKVLERLLQFDEQKILSLLCDERMFGKKVVLMMDLLDEYASSSSQTASSSS